MSFQLSDYDFDLPPERIAQRPAIPRDSSRLMVLDRSMGGIAHRVFRELPEILHQHDKKGSVVVANNTQVIRARLLGTRPGSGGKVEFVLLEELAPRVWEGLFHASARYERGLRFHIPTPDGKGLDGTLVRGVGESPHGTVVAEFDRDPIASGAGVVPLPHYIHSSAHQDPNAAEDYQTVYSKIRGSAAAPTAGLHFTPDVLKRISENGIDWQEITLHVGLGTFRPVKETDIRHHKMHEERYWISEDTRQSILAAHSLEKKILAVGTTTLRCLESAWYDGDLHSGPNRTGIFIYPGSEAFQKFHIADHLLTNFHLPKSSLLMLVSAFASREMILEAYRQAVAEKYRFFSYGDAMLIL